MKFEKEILRDYPRFLKYVKINKAYFRKALFLNKATATDEDIVNDAIVKFFEDDPHEYSYEILEKHMRHFLYIEDKKIKDFSFDDQRDVVVQEEKLFEQETTSYERNIVDDFKNEIPFLKTARCDYFIFQNNKVVSLLRSTGNYKVLKPSIVHNRITYSHWKKKASQLMSHRVYAKHFGDIKKGCKIIYIDGNINNNNPNNLKLYEPPKRRCLKRRFKMLKFVAYDLFFRDYSREVKMETKSTKVGAPMGRGHGKFKGFYVVYGKRYHSSYHADRCTGLNYRTIQRKCKQNRDGFYFVEI